MRHLGGTAMYASRFEALPRRLIRMIILFTLLALAGSPVFTRPTFASPAASSAAAPPIDKGPVRALIAKASKQGSVRIIVGVQTAAQPEGSIKEPVGLRQQRAGIARAQQSVVNTHGKEKLRHIKRFRVIPFMAMEVDGATLGAL